MNSHANFTYSFPTLKIILIPSMTRSNRFWFISLIACTGPLMPETLLLCDIDLLVARHTSKKLLALLNHSFWGVHIAGWNQSFTSWSVHIAGKNWAFSSAVEKLSRHCPGMEYQHKREHTSKILCRIQKHYCSPRYHITTRGATTAPNGTTNIRWFSCQSPITSKPYPTITVSTGNCLRNYPQIWP